MNSYYTQDELQAIGFHSFGDHVLISKKASIYTPEKISIGSHVRIDDFCILSGDISIGNFVHIGAFSTLFGSHGIEIQDFSGLSSRVTIYSASDDYSGAYLTNPTVPSKYRGLTTGKVTLEKHVIVGAGSLILPKVTLKEGSSIGAMTFISKSTKEWTIYFGCPAKAINNRKRDLLDLEKDLIKKLGESR